MTLVFLIIVERIRAQKRDLLFMSRHTQSDDDCISKSQLSHPIETVTLE